jgi:hypothetical protein
MFRRQITIALACAGLICASITSNTAKQNTTAKEPVLVARSAPQGMPGSGRRSTPGGKQGNPRGDKPVVTV